MQIYFASFLVLALFSVFGYEVAGRCASSYGTVESNWVTCLKADSNSNCPYGLLKLEETSCKITGRTSPRRSKRVCCLLAPAIDLKVKNAPCLSAGKANDEDENAI
ncbi:uncharacterized protein LOC114975179 [Acropora millepora]|uniref:uncharacterized protein LOC114975179 n=1 Tax=Acropora millepora TaxID=45264 RepID=UPI001CF3A4C1|nr:uncharacterized protein LOC114975179 [Acropora millepora]